MKKYILSILLSLLFTLQAAAATDQPLRLPKLKGFLNDYAYVLEPTEAADIERTLSEYEDEANVQLIVVTMRDTGVENIYEFSQRLWSKNNIGRHKRYKNKGALLVINTEKQKAIIKVHSKIKDSLTESVTNKILEDLLPEIKKKNYYKGIFATIADIRNIITSEKKLNENTNKKWTYLIFGIIIGGALLMGFILLVRRKRN